MPTPIIHSLRVKIDSHNCRQNKHPISYLNNRLKYKNESNSSIDITGKNDIAQQ